MVCPSHRGLEHGYTEWDVRHRRRLSMAVGRWIVEHAIRKDMGDLNNVLFRQDAASIIAFNTLVILSAGVFKIR
jgi:hypothetical protein